MYSKLVSAAVVLLVTLSLCGVTAAASTADPGSPQTAKVQYPFQGLHVKAERRRYEGSMKTIFELNGAQFGEPSVKFEPFCPVVTYDYLFSRYKLSLPLSINIKTLRWSLSPSTRLGNITLSDVKPLLDSGFPNDAGVTFRLHRLDDNRAELLLLCNTFERFRQLNLVLISRPHSLQQSIKFEISATVDDIPIKFSPMSSSTTPSVSCPVNEWVVFQRRVDGSLSFAQNWDTYEKGFGDPSANYWMGLEQLFLSTVTNEQNRERGPTDLSRCQLRVETESADGTKNSADWAHFQVLAPEQDFRLRVGQLRNNKSEWTPFEKQHNERTFSTYDRHDSECSRQYGFGGWWFDQCSSGLYLNGAYPVNVTSKSPKFPFMGASYKTGWTPLKTSTMMFKCKN